MSRRGARFALAVVGVFGISLGLVTSIAYQLGKGHAKVVTKIQNVYYPVPSPSPIATDVAPVPKPRVSM